MWDVWVCEGYVGECVCVCGCMSRYEWGVWGCVSRYEWGACVSV